MVEQHGFIFEEHTVTTEDGYILTLHRIKGAPGSKTVLLQHGVQDASINWLDNGNEIAPAFLLARAGHDVWMGNNRGNFYSMGHTSLSNKKKEYWQHDFEDFGL